MAFCSQCGFLLPPKVTACPRCDAAVVAVGDADSQNADDPTIVSGLDKTERSGNAYGSKTDLMQGPKPLAGSNDLTQGIEPGMHTPSPVSVPHTPLPENYMHTPIPPPPPDYMVRNDSAFSMTQGRSYPGNGFPTGPGFLPSMIPPQRTRSKKTLFAMILILSLVALIVGGTAVVFAIGPDRVLQAIRGGSTSSQPTTQATTLAQPPLSSPTSQPQVPTPTPVVSTPTPVITLTPEQQGRSVVNRYFTAINNKDYQTAYNLWANYGDTYQNFANGFANTQHDDYQFGQIVVQSDGTVQVNVTLVATSTSSQQTSYQGYYIVGQQGDGSWKIVTAKISLA